MLANTPDHTPRAFDRSRVALSASAILLALLLTLQLAKLPSALRPSLIPAAHADLISLKTGDHSMLTFNGGTDDILVVLDSRGEQLLTYRIRQQRNFELLSAYSLPDMFMTAQRMGVGGGGGSR
ncbi:MAG: hypothetical protein KF768_09180 [Phycisphaeraceae bacterium]|nr:hypothetical protein [Phycisphaeraceae bacterium]